MTEEDKKFMCERVCAQRRLVLLHRKKFESDTNPPDMFIDKLINQGDEIVELGVHSGLGWGRYRATKEEVEQLIAALQETLK